MRKATIIRLHAVRAQQETQASRTNQTLYGDCTSNNETRQLSCIRYLQGVAEMMGVVASFHNIPNLPQEKKDDLMPFSVCSGESVTGAEVQQVFVNWAKANPKEWQKPEILGAWSAIETAWHCN